MSHNRNNLFRRPRRLRATAIGLGAAAGALLAAALSQLAAAPTARADDFSDIVANVDISIGYAQDDFTGATSEFALGTPAGFAAGLALDTAGTNDILFAPTEDVIVGSVQAATGQTPTAYFGFDPAMDPATLTDLQTLVTADFAAGTADLNLAVEAFALGTPAGFAEGVSFSLSVFDLDAVAAPEQALIGFADLLGL